MKLLTELQLLLARCAPLAVPKLTLTQRFLPDSFDFAALRWSKKRLAASLASIKWLPKAGVYGLVFSVMSLFLFSLTFNYGFIFLLSSRDFLPPVICCLSVPTT